MKETISLKRCEVYNYKIIKEKINESLEELGGIEKYISTSDKVLLKINMLMKKKPEEATTTHPVIVEALADILIERGNEVIIGDSPGGPFNKSVLKNLYKHTGMETVSLKTGAKLNFNVKSFDKETPDGVILKKMIMTDMLNDVDKVISISKLKTHGMMTFTGAVKNMFGTIPGVLKAEYHMNIPSYEDFGKALVDICHAANPCLSIMDGIIGMEGSGPSSGTPRKIGVILTSTSPYHLDKAACKIVGIDFSKVPTIVSAIERNFSTDDLNDIEFLGDKLESFRVNDFKLPESSSLNLVESHVPKFLYPFIEKHFKAKPVFIHKKCIGCGVCEDNCPARVISDSKDKKPQVDLKNCIRCYCCQELCPKKAVEIKKSFVFK